MIFFHSQAWSKEHNHTYIATPSQSWIDDYFDWAKDCCVYNATPKWPDDGFCPTDIDTSSLTASAR